LARLERPPVRAVAERVLQEALGELAARVLARAREALADPFASAAHERQRTAGLRPLAHSNPQAEPEPVAHARTRACTRRLPNGSALHRETETDTVRAPVTCRRSRLAADDKGKSTVLKGMRKRRVLTGLGAAAIFVGGIAASVLPASADPRTLIVTLATGQTLTVTVDVPPGTPIDQIQIPGITTPIVGVSEVPQPPPPPSDQPPAPAPGAAPVQATPEAPSAAPATDNQAKQQPQKQTGKAKRKAKDKVEGVPAGAQRVTGGALRAAKGKADKPAPTRTPGGAPTPDNPTFSLALPGPAPIGVPNFFIDKFRIPPFL